MDVQALPTCILPGLKNAFGLSFYICNAMLFLSVLFQRRKQLSAFRHARKTQFPYSSLLHAACLYDEGSALNPILLRLWKEQATRMHFAHLKNAPEHVLPDSGSVSVRLQDAEHCSKRVFQFL